MNKINETAAKSVTKKPRQVKPINAGDRFDRLVVLEILPPHPTKNRQCRVRCNCGNEKVVVIGSLHHGLTTSCGCFRKEVTMQLNWKHGCALDGQNRPEYKSWRGMRSRCRNPNNPGYKKWYGAKHVKVCKAFDHFPNFLATIGPMTPPKDSVDRIDNDGNYSCGECDECKSNRWPMNVRWATNKEQANNRSSNHKITFNGETKNATQWSEIFGISRDLALSRIHQGWNPVEAVSMSLEDSAKRRIERFSAAYDKKRENNFLEFKGEKLSKVGWADKLGISLSTLHVRLRK